MTAAKRATPPKRRAAARPSTLLVISLPRLFLYHRALEDALRDGRQMVTSAELSRRVGRGISSAQVRKDLSHIGSFGRRGHGYDVVVLVRKLARELGLDRDWRIAIVGFGYLGHALATFLEYREEKFHIAGIFDNDDAIVGTQWHGVRISHADDLERVLPVLGCSIGIITVPAGAAQKVADRLVRCGITAILNFAPATLKVPSSVALRAIDLASELSILTSHLGPRTPSTR
ncbi:MAG TPA: redox-sensing transcriptional repressor Rex [Candidatus Eremiobacteraceae bacterium]|nr:redox-sensing transcriptional repressor Rex [Candidatus Eremiobacteraceae bacterium]